mmetsp:Transcript_8917/g.24849  ORF Transcript_8917/g.24849 Transcript_8917/m.24849 type:complete len:239 (-) Transcript_8917:29-745(-)
MKSSSDDSTADYPSNSAKILRHTTLFRHLFRHLRNTAQSTLTFHMVCLHGLSPIGHRSLGRQCFLDPRSCGKHIWVLLAKLALLDLCDPDQKRNNLRREACAFEVPTESAQTLCHASVVFTPASLCLRQLPKQTLQLPTAGMKMPLNSCLLVRLFMICHRSVRYEPRIEGSGLHEVHRRMVGRIWECCFCTLSALGFRGHMSRVLAVCPELLTFDMSSAAKYKRCSLTCDLTVSVHRA